MACLHLVVLEMEKQGRIGRCASLSGLTLSTKDSAMAHMANFSMTVPKGVI